jgi:hypothetical protein
MGNTHRTTISIPLELKARMDAVVEDINWSELACRAFEQKLAEITSTKGVKDMKDVAIRLRASKHKLSGVRYKDGFRAGQRWAKDTADAEELERLEGVRNCRSPGEWASWWHIKTRGGIGPCDRFIHAITPPHPEAGGREVVGNFWEGHGGFDWEERSFDGDFVQGFAEGALDIWDRVKDEL